VLLQWLAESNRYNNKPGKDCCMKYKHLAAAVYLCITCATLSASVTAEQIASLDSGHYHPHETSSLSGDTTQGSARTNDPARLNLLDTVWIFGFTIAGLVLLRKVQG